MEYEIGDTVQLESGSIVTITAKMYKEDRVIYGQGNPYAVITEKIVRKIED